MTYQEAIAEIQKDLNKTYIGFIFKLGEKGESSYFSYYYISVPDLEDPEWIIVGYNGGYLFSTCGEDDSYSLDEVPEDAKKLNYISTDIFPEDILIKIDWDCSEYALFKLFPELPDPEDLWSGIEKFEFAKLADLVIKKYSLSN